MEVETFECEETITEPIEASAEAVSLITELGLEGQQSLLNPETQEGEVVRCPYRKIRRDESFVYKRLCPRSTRLEEFSDCPIPLRVLQIAAHAKQFDVLKAFWIWSAEGKVKDPVLIACTEEATYQKGDTFILARWGDVLDSWPLLVEKAVELWRQKCRAKFAEIKGSVAKDEAVLEAADLDKAMKDGEPHYYW